MMSSPKWPQGARLLIDAEQIDEAMAAQAKRIETLISNDQEVTLMALMNGGVLPAVSLVQKLQSPIKLDYVHATRYREERTGRDLQWVRRPEKVSGTVVVVDDIFDEGYTMAAVKASLLASGATRVITVVAVKKMHDRGLPRDWVDDAALEVPDEYVFGFGMDLDGLWRQLDSIWSVS